MLAPSGDASSADAQTTRLAVLAPFKDGDAVTNGPGSAMHLTFPAWLEALFADKRAELVPIYTFAMHKDAFSREYILPVVLPRLLERGEIRGNPVRLLKEGSVLERAKAGLELLRSNKVSGEKIVLDLQFDALATAMRRAETVNCGNVILLRRVKGLISRHLSVMARTATCAYTRADQELG